MALRTVRFEQTTHELQKSRTAPVRKSIETGKAFLGATGSYLITRVARTQFVAHPNAFFMRGRAFEFRVPRVYERSAVGKNTHFAEIAVLWVVAVQWVVIILWLVAVRLAWSLSESASCARAACCWAAGAVTGVSCAWMLRIGESAELFFSLDTSAQVRAPSASAKRPQRPPAVSDVVGEKSLRFMRPRVSSS